MVGLDRIELSTSRLSGVRSNHLSYRPGLSAESVEMTNKKNYGWFHKTRVHWSLKAK